MTPEQFSALIERLDKIVLLLEMQTIIPDDEPACAHRRAIDMGVMGDTPGAKMRCQDCGETFSRIAEG